MLPWHNFLKFAGATVHALPNPVRNKLLNKNQVMEHLFSTNISVANRPVRFEVNFDHEKYIFQPETSEMHSGAFSLRRDHDEWHEEGKLSPEIKSQAVEVLEKYLMKQH